MRTVAAMSGAVDLSGLRAKADAARSAQQRPSAPPGSDGPGGADNVPDQPGQTDAIGTVIDVTDQTFATAVIEPSAQKLFVVNLSASWSEQSAQLDPVLEKLAGEYGGAFVLARVDVDASPGIVQAFRAQSVPMVIAVAAGRPVDAFAGVQPEDSLRAWLDNLFTQLESVLGPVSGVPEAPADPRLEAAEQLAADGDYAGAKAAYEAILNAEPANREAAAAAKQMDFMERATQLAPDAIERADADPEDAELAFAAADAEVLARRQEDAFARLIALVKRTTGDERAAARARLVDLFDLFDSADPTVTAARRSLAAALF